jgi:amidase
VVGPIAHSISDIRYLIKTVLQAEPWFKDPKCIELPWRSEHVDMVKGRPLNIGLIKWDHLIMPHPPVQRGIRLVEQALKSQGHDIFNFAVPDPHEADRLIVHHLVYCAYSSLGFIGLMGERISLMLVRYRENLSFRI